MNTIHKQQIPIPRTSAEVCGPVPGTVMIPEYASVIARMAYVWGWPLVNMHNRREMFRKMPALPTLVARPWHHSTGWPCIRITLIRYNAMSHIPTRT